jgi:hypothetical protein
MIRGLRGLLGLRSETKEEVLSRDKALLPGW